MEVGSSTCFEDLEEGEVSDDSADYTPLTRPNINQSLIKVESMATEVSNYVDNQKPDKMVEQDDSVSDFGQSSDSSSDSDDCMKTSRGISLKNSKKDNKKRTVLLRVKPSDEVIDKKSKFKKYDIWTKSLQEDSLMENMRGIDVTKNKQDRNVENYDFSLKYRLNGENTLKRRLSTSGEDMSDGSNSKQYYHSSKRTKSSERKSRQGKRSNNNHHHRGRGRSTSSCDSNQNIPRNIIDLSDAPNRSDEDIAREIANKLYEEKDDLMLRIVQILGRELPIQLFKETQKIEKDGGMMIINGKRRRTPGGVFLFLLKHNETISSATMKEIFSEEKKATNRDQKTMQALKRDQKVEELKKRLNEREKELNCSGNNHENSSKTHLKPESLSLSNPPPSPVANSCAELSPEYNKTPTIINHVADTPIEKLILAKSIHNDLEDESLTAYDDDFLDMTCDDMELM